MSQSIAFMDDMHVTALVVTFNRKELLLKCLNALWNQTRRPDQLFVVDNASSDGTENALGKNDWFKKEEFRYLKLPENTGGGGGFQHGLRILAQDKKTEWIWMMDDDALPYPNALEEILKIKPETVNIYGSAAISDDKLAWPMSFVSSFKSKRITSISELSEPLEVTFIPFLGFLMHISLLERIGYPEGGYFIAADDVEYCFRAKKLRSRIFLVEKSRIEHPPAIYHCIHLFNFKINCLKLPPWKRYYDTRNRLLVSRTHMGFKLFTQTIPGTIIRLFTVLIQEPGRCAQLRAFIAGIIDGLLGFQGRRHNLWGILDK